MKKARIRKNDIKNTKNDIKKTVFDNKITT